MGQSVYAYVGGNPVNYVDPLGLFCLSNAQIGGISGAIGIPNVYKGGAAGGGAGASATSNGCEC